MLNNKIVLIANSSFYLYNFRQSLITSLSKDGYELVVLAPDDDYSDKLQEAKVIPLKHLDRKSMNPIKDFALSLELFSVLKKEKPSCVMTFTIKPNIYGSFACGLLKIPLIANITGLGYLFIKTKRQLVHVFIDFMYRVAFRFPRYYVFQNSEDVSMFISRYKIGSEKCLITPGSGISLDKYQYSKLPESKTDSFLMVARVLVDKGVKEYITAATILKEKYPNVKVTLIGPIDSKNPAGISLQKLNSLNANDVVDYLGEKKDVREYLAQCSCFVLPSYREGTPRTNLEAMAMGRPIITTDVPGCRETVEEGINGFFVPPKDAKALADAMIKLVELPYEQKLAMGKYSRAKAEKEFDEKIVINKYLQLLKTIPEMTNDKAQMSK
jgi:glycosyltransferase involved in cell wall biosynthesis